VLLIPEHFLEGLELAYLAASRLLELLLTTEQLAMNISDCFEKILDIMDHIGSLLQCYELFTRAYQFSTDMMDLLVEAYKSIIQFWKAASKTLNKKCS
jgi:hypothetical protein